MDGAHLAVLVKEAVALIALRNAGAGLSLSPQVADFWIGGTSERTLEHQLVHCISRHGKEPCSVATLLFVYAYYCILYYCAELRNKYLHNLRNRFIK